MTGSAPTSGTRMPSTLADTLRRTRLAHREERLLLVLAALDDRVRATRQATGATTVPEPLTAAVTEFREELRAVRDELRTLTPPGP